MQSGTAINVGLRFFAAQKNLTRPTYLVKSLNYARMQYILYMGTNLTFLIRLVGCEKNFPPTFKTYKKS